MKIVACLVTLPMLSSRIVAQSNGCIATPTSLTPAAWPDSSPRAAAATPRGVLRAVTDIGSDPSTLSARLRRPGDGSAG